MNEEKELRIAEMSEIVKAEEGNFDFRPAVNDYYPVERPEDIALHLYKSGMEHKKRK